MKKRIIVGASSAGHPPHFRRIIYSKNAQQEIQATRQTALSWFRRYRYFDITVSGKSYAAAVKTKVRKSNVVVHNVENLNTKHSVKNSINKSIPYRSVREYPVSAAKQS